MVSCSGSVCAVSYCVCLFVKVYCAMCSILGVLCGLLCAVCSVVHRRAKSRHEPGWSKDKRCNLLDYSLFQVAPGVTYYTCELCQGVRGVSVIAK